MKKLTLAFTYNVRHSFPDPKSPQSQLEADFDEPKTIAAIVKHIASLGYKVIPIEANEKAYFKLHKYRKKIDLVFNYAEGIYGQDREAHIPAILEMLKIPYVGVPPLTQALVLNKAKAKEIFITHGVPTPRFEIFYPQEKQIIDGLRFPLLVKPVAEGSSAGITNKSVVLSKSELKKQVSFIHDTFKEPALVETFLKGRDFTVPMLGNPPIVLPIVEFNHNLLPKDYIRMNSIEVKWYFSHDSKSPYYLCPARISKKLQRKIERICLKVWKALGLRDWCRIDIRCDEDENPYVLEVNVPASLTPPDIFYPISFLLSAEAVGMTYDDILKTVINAARKRYGI